MPEQLQTRKNHARIDPSFHFVLIPGLVFVFVWAAVHLVRRPGTDAALLLIFSALILLSAYKARTNALKVQDRIIRLEERLRLASLASPALQARAGQITESQWIALRFACDQELPTLAERALNERLTNKQIKDAIQNWRPDFWRV